jgi:hypothetical protein
MEALRAVPPEQRLAAGWLGARRAVDRTGLHSEMVDGVLAGMAGHDLTALVQNLDGRYFELEEASGVDEASRAAFAAARAASAVVFTQGGQPVEAATKPDMPRVTGWAPNLLAPLSR